jgi:hypothetical protein
MAFGNIVAGLSVPQSATDGLVQVLSLLRFWVAAVVDARQLSVAAASDDLTNFSCHTDPSG